MGLIETLRTATAGGTTSGGRCEIHGCVDAPFDSRGGLGTTSPNDHRPAVRRRPAWCMAANMNAPGGAGGVGAAGREPDAKASAAAEVRGVAAIAADRVQASGAVTIDVERRVAGEPVQLDRVAGGCTGAKDGPVEQHDAAAGNGTPAHETSEHQGAVTWVARSPASARSRSAMLRGREPERARHDRHRLCARSLLGNWAPSRSVLLGGRHDAQRRHG